HAFHHALAVSEIDRVVALDLSVVAFEGEIGVEGKAGLDLLARLAEPAQQRQTTAQEKEVPGNVAILADGFSQPQHGLLVFAEASLRFAEMVEPHIKQ